MTVAYLMNRMPSRVLGYKTPIECLTRDTTYVVPPKVFGCTCFVKDYRPSVDKLDPKALKCIFVGYSSKQKGYKCWCPSERRMFVSMDVVFREHEPFYGEPTDLTDVFPDLFTDNLLDADCGIGGDKEEGDDDTTSKGMIIGVIRAETEEEQRKGEQYDTSNAAPRWPKPNEEREMQVYTRKRHTQEQMQVLEPEAEAYGQQHEQEQEADQQDDTQSQPDDSIPSSDSGNISSQYDDLDVPIAHRKQPRSKAGKLPSKLDPYNVSSYVSYDTVGPSYKSFMAALDYAVPLCRIESMSKGVIRLLDQIKI